MGRFQREAKVLALLNHPNVGGVHGLEAVDGHQFDLLGTPVEHKKRLVYTRGHNVPKVELIRESLAWLDRYLGQVE